MKNLDVIRAWKDETFRLSLNKDTQETLLAHPAGLIELTHDDLGDTAAAVKDGLTACVCTYDAACFSLSPGCIAY